MSTPVCYRCHRPLKSAESIARGYGSECYRIVSDEIHTGMHSLVSMCFEMNIQANSAVVLPEIVIKRKYEPTQMTFIDALFEGKKDE
jgi:hypothetical protein